jgi:hypothetical protein
MDVHLITLLTMAAYRVESILGFSDFSEVWTNVLRSGEKKILYLYSSFPTWSQRSGEKKVLYLY